MKVKFKFEVYDTAGMINSVVSGSADKQDIDAAIEYLLKLKEERYNSGQRDLASIS